MTVYNRRTRLFRYLLLFYLLFTPVVLSLQSVLIHPAYGQLVPFKFQSRPADHATDLVVPNPMDAYDGENITTWVDLSRDVDGYFELSDFGTRSGKVNRVDFKMRCKADASTDDRYRILYFVDPSSEEKVLVNWTTSSLTEMTYVWEFAAEPNDGVWTSTDVSNVRFRVEIDAEGTPDGMYFRVYEAWLTMFLNYPIVSVDPPEILDPYLTPDSEFTIDITVDYVENLANYQFEMSFNPDVVHGVSVENGPFLGSAGGDVMVIPGHGFDNTAGVLNLFGATLDPVDVNNPSGGGVLAIVTFRVVGSGVSDLTLGEYTQLMDATGAVIVDGINMPVCLKHGYFSNEGFTLEVESAPMTGVSFDLEFPNATVKPYETPFSKMLRAGDYTVQMPSEWTVGETEYVFLRWENGSTSATRGIELTENMTITATYMEAGLEYTLTVGSAPIAGVNFTLQFPNATVKSYETNITKTLPAGGYTIKMPAHWTVDESVYEFDSWTDDPTAGSTRGIELTENMSLTATYKEARYTLTIESTPVAGVNFTLNDEPYQTPFSEALLAGSYTVNMSLRWEVSGVVFKFIAWEDDPTADSLRVVELMSDTSLSAIYIEVAEYSLEIDSVTIDGTPMTGVTFTLKFPNATVESYETPFNETLSAEKYTVGMPDEWTVGETGYEFLAWTDLVDTPNRTFILGSDMSLTAIYMPAEEEYKLEINAMNAVDFTPIQDIDFKLDDSDEITPFSSVPLLKAGNHVVQMPAEWEDGGTRYWFVRWDGTASKNPTKVVTLTSNMSLTAVYADLSVHNVDKDTYYEKIQWAIGNATADDTIEVYPNIYYEHLYIDKPLELLGKDPYTTIIDGITDLYNDVIWVDLTENVIISGFTLQNSYWSGITLLDSSHNTFSGNIVIDCDTGIWVEYSDLNTITDNIVLNSYWEGIYLADSSYNTVSGNTISNCYDGIWVDYDSHYNTIVSNTFSNSGEYGIALWYPSCNNTIYHNNFLENAEQAYDEGAYGDNSWNTTYPSGGNYWSDYTGVDVKSGPNQDKAGSDAIGDIPYEILDYSKDNYPLMTPRRMCFNVVWDDMTYEVYITSNSTITAFKFSQPNKQISFNLTGSDGTTGFCKVNILKDLLDAPPGEWTVLVNGTQVTAEVVSGTIWNQLYFAYNHSMHIAEIEGTIVVDNIPPIADAGPDQTVDQDTAVTFDGSASWDDIAIRNYKWTFEENGTTTDLVGETNATTFENPGFYFVTLEVTDWGDNSDTDTVLITVRDTEAPTADAGPDQTVDEDTLVFFDGSNSTDNAGIVSYVWTFKDVTPWKTKEGRTVTYTFETPPGPYTVELKVTDARGNPGTDTVGVTVRDTTKPVANASRTPTSVKEDTPIRLDGTASTDNVGIEEYTWYVEDVAPQTLYGENQTYEGWDTPGVYNVTLKVSDAAGNWNTIQLDITVLDITKPEADAGPTQIVDEDTVVTLDGSASSDNDPFHDLSYAWTFFNGTLNVTLTGVKPTYNFTSPGDYIVTLNVTDAAGNWDTDKTIIMVRDATVPRAVADVYVDGVPSDTVDEDRSVTFNGSRSTDNIGIESYTWTFTDGGVPKTLHKVIANYTFENPGVYPVTLMVTDGEGKSDTDSVMITVLDITAPVANAGSNQTVDEDTVVMFDGSASQDNGAIKSYTWAFTENGKLQKLKGVSPNYIFVTPGVYKVTLNVTDAADNSATDDVEITVYDATAPTADAGSDQTVDEDTSATLNGSASTDNVGIESYVWTFTEGNTSQTLTGIYANHTFAEPGDYTVTLKVTDAAGNFDTDTVKISVLPSSGSLPILDIALVALAGAAVAIGIASFMRKGSKS